MLGAFLRLYFKGNFLMSPIAPKKKLGINAYKCVADSLCLIETLRSNTVRIGKLENKLQDEQIEPLKSLDSESVAVLVGYINELSVKLETAISSSSNEHVAQQFRVLALSARLLASAVNNELSFKGDAPCG